MLNADDPVCVGYAAHTGAPSMVQQHARGRRPAPVCAATSLVLDGKLLMTAGEIPIRGRHNVENVLAAAIAAARAGVAHAAIAAAVRTFRAVEHRLEFVRNVSGVDFYNDSKATSVDATLKALDAFPGGLWVILGGKDKGLDYAPLRAPLPQKAHAALLIGAAAPKIAAQLEGAVPLVEARNARCGRRLCVRATARPATPCCSLRPAPASISFAATNIAAKSFKQLGERTGSRRTDMAQRSRPTGFCSPPCWRWCRSAC